MSNLETPISLMVVRLQEEAYGTQGEQESTEGSWDSNPHPWRCEGTVCPLSHLALATSIVESVTETD